MTRVLRTNADPTEKRTNIRAVLLLVWLVIGALAAAERGNSTSGDTTCAGASTIAVTVLPGPLDYVGVDPQVQCPQLPQPSSQRRRRP